ncbi:MAG: hypothetical protein IKM73_07660 [Acidaminococcaceae bacterium]|nr:hypothetical protein [Acidaminococcaceae bacterium]
MADVHTWTGTATEEETAMMVDQMKLFIFPNEARTDDEIEAFNKAVAYQIAHEHSLHEQQGDIPSGVNSFKIGDFSMSFEEGVNGIGLTRKTICPAAYSVLLLAGLLYRGLEGRCCL